MSARLTPAASLDTRFFWDGARDQKLLIQRCVECQKLRHPPRPACPDCNSFEWDSVEAAGTGTVHSYCIPHHPKLPGFEEPYVVGLIDLDEGVRLVSNIVDVDPAEVSNGQRVEVTFATFDALDGDGDIVLPQFRPTT